TSGRITTPGPDEPGASANAAVNSVPSPEVSVSPSAPAPPAIGAQTRSSGRSGGRESKPKHIRPQPTPANGLRPSGGLDGRGARVDGAPARDRLARRLRLEHHELPGSLEDLAQEPVGAAVRHL